MKNLFKFALAAFTVAMFAVACGNKTEEHADAAVDSTATTTEEAMPTEEVAAPADTAAMATDSAAAPAEAAPAH